MAAKDPRLDEIMTCLQRNLPLNSDQLNFLSTPEVIGSLEKQLNMPITHDLKFFTFNFKLHNYTTQPPSYYTPKIMLYLAATDGLLCAVKQLATEHPTMVREEFTNWLNEPIPMIARRGQLAVLNYLITFINKPRVRTSSVYHYTVCASGDVEAFKCIRSQIGLDNIDLLCQAAINNGHVNILTMLDDMDSRAQYSNLVSGAQSGHVGVMEYMLARYITLELNTRRKITLLKASLAGGNPRVINLILRYTKLKFKLEYLPSIIAGDNLSILQRFERQFGDGFRAYVVKHQQDIVADTNNLQIITFLLKHGLDLKTVIRSSKCRTNCGILDLAVNTLGLKTVRQLIGDTTREPYVEDYLNSHW